MFHSRFYQRFTNISGEPDLQKISQNEEIKNMRELKLIIKTELIISLMEITTSQI